MKKVVLLFSAVVLFAGLTFAQTPQAPDKSAKAGDKKECTKDAKKSGCDMKSKEACSHSKEGKSCCSKDGKKPAATTPEKK
jgi:hypothetical protein